MSENGAISLDVPLSTPPRTPGPSLAQDADNIFLIAPFWIEISLQRCQQIRYETYERGIAPREDRIDMISRTVANQTNNPQMTVGRWMILVEWDSCMLLDETGQVWPAKS